ncbi:hypothetical protein ABO04_00970 [Nitrosomonas sp. HPC101]|nr:hypothetical protein [Nitrosomonas sp. HPC101]
MVSTVDYGKRKQQSSNREQLFKMESFCVTPIVYHSPLPAVSFIFPGIISIILPATICHIFKQVLSRHNYLIIRIT